MYIMVKLVLTTTHSSGQWSIGDQLQIWASALAKWTYWKHNLMYMIWWWGKPEYQEETYTSMGSTCNIVREALLQHDLNHAVFYNFIDNIFSC